MDKTFLEVKWVQLLVNISLFRGQERTDLYPGSLFSVALMENLSIW